MCYNEFMTYNKLLYSFLEKNETPKELQTLKGKILQQDINNLEHKIDGVIDRIELKEWFHNLKTDLKDKFSESWLPVIEFILCTKNNTEYSVKTLVFVNEDDKVIGKLRDDSAKNSINDFNEKVNSSNHKTIGTLINFPKSLKDYTKEQYNLYLSFAKTLDVALNSIAEEELKNKYKDLLEKSKLQRYISLWPICDSLNSISMQMNNFLDPKNYTDTEISNIKYIIKIIKTAEEDIQKILPKESITTQINIFKDSIPCGDSQLSINGDIIKIINEEIKK